MNALHIYITSLNNYVTLKTLFWVHKIIPRAIEIVEQLNRKGMNECELKKAENHQF